MSSDEEPIEEPVFTGLFRLSAEEKAGFLRAMKGIAGLLLLLLLLLAPLLRGGFFQDQARQKEARRLVEFGGWAWCAIKGDGSDPAQLMPMNSPYRPHWTGRRNPSGDYRMTLSYNRGNRIYRHEWDVDLVRKTVIAVTPNTDTPVSVTEGRKRCSEDD